MHRRCSPSFRPAATGFSDAVCNPLWSYQPKHTESIFCKAGPLAHIWNWISWSIGNEKGPPGCHHLSIQSRRLSCRGPPEPSGHVSPGFLWALPYPDPDNHSKSHVRFEILTLQSISTPKIVLISEKWRLCSLPPPRRQPSTVTDNEIRTSAVVHRRQQLLSPAPPLSLTSRHYPWAVPIFWKLMGLFLLGLIGKIPLSFGCHGKVRFPLLNLSSKAETLRYFYLLLP